MARIKTLKTHEIVDGVKVPISKETLQKVTEADKKEAEQIAELQKRKNAQPATLEPETKKANTTTTTAAATTGKEKKAY